MKNSFVAVLLGALTLMTVQLPAQTEAPKPPFSGTSATPTTAQPEQPPKTTYEMRKLATVDLSNIRLNLVSGHLVFTAAGIDTFITRARMLTRHPRETLRPALQFSQSYAGLRHSRSKFRFGSPTCHPTETESRYQN
jgi:hypothetical protein